MVGSRSYTSSPHSVAMEVRRCFNTEEKESVAADGRFKITRLDLSAIHPKPKSLKRKAPDDLRDIPDTMCYPKNPQALPVATPTHLKLPIAARHFTECFLPEKNTYLCSFSIEDPTLVQECISHIKENAPKREEIQKWEFIGKLNNDKMHVVTNAHGNVIEASISQPQNKQIIDDHFISKEDATVFVGLPQTTHFSFSAALQKVVENFRKNDKLKRDGIVLTEDIDDFFEKEVKDPVQREVFMKKAESFFKNIEKDADGRMCSDHYCHDALEIRRFVHGPKGRGVFVKEGQSIKKGELISFYLGQTVLEEETAAVEAHADQHEKERMNAYKFVSQPIFYGKKQLKSIVYAHESNGVGGLLNGPTYDKNGYPNDEPIGQNESVAPNVCPALIFFDDYPYIVLLAEKDIKEKEELTWDYGARFWSCVAFGKQFKPYTALNMKEILKKTFVPNNLPSICASANMGDREIRAMWQRLRDAQAAPHTEILLLDSDHFFWIEKIVKKADRAFYICLHVGASNIETFKSHFVKETTPPGVFIGEEDARNTKLVSITLERTRFDKHDRSFYCLRIAQRMLSSISTVREKLETGDKTVITSYIKEEIESLIEIYGKKSRAIFQKNQEEVQEKPDFNRPLSKIDGGS